MFKELAGAEIRLRTTPDLSSEMAAIKGYCLRSSFCAMFSLLIRTAGIATEEKLLFVWASGYILWSILQWRGEREEGRSEDERDSRRERRRYGERGEGGEGETRTRKKQMRKSERGKESRGE